MFAQLQFLRLDGEERRKDADGNLQAGGFFARNRKEAHVLEGGGPRGFDDSLEQGSYGKDVTNAAADVTFQVKSGERTALLLQVIGDGGQRQFALIQSAINSLMSQAEKQLAFFRRILAGRGNRALVRRAGGG
jgi:hypothetical protein